MTGQHFAAFCGVKYSTLMSWVGKARRGAPPVNLASEKSGVIAPRFMVNSQVVGVRLERDQLWPLA